MNAQPRWGVRLGTGLICLGILVTAGGCRAILVNTIAWSIALPLEAANILKPRPGQRPARDYLFGYRLRKVRVRAEPPSIDAHVRELYEFADSNHDIYAIKDGDGGITRAYVPRRGGDSVRFESRSPGGALRAVPGRSRRILEQIID